MRARPHLAVALLTLAATGPLLAACAGLQPPLTEPSHLQARSSSAPAQASGSPPSSVLLVAAGDIACNPLDRKYGIGLGEETGCRQRATSDLIARLRPTVLMPLGDNQYQHGTYRGFISSYAQTWGRFLSITHPVIGNHEYDTPHAAGYFAYFGRRAGSPHKAYYSFDLGRWHIVVLNDTGCRYIGGCGPGSPQERWLRHDLRTHRNRCTLAAWHKPRWSSGEHGSQAVAQAMWSDLVRFGVDIAIAGHDHDYERLEPLDGLGRVDLRRGVRSFIVGTGGVGLRGFDHHAPGSLVRESDTFGVLALRLDPGRYSWRFVPVGDGFHDRGSGRCH